MDEPCENRLRVMPSDTFAEPDANRSVFPLGIDRRTNENGPAIRRPVLAC